MAIRVVGKCTNEDGLRGRRMLSKAHLGGPFRKIGRLPRLQTWLAKAVSVYFSPPLPASFTITTAQYSENRKKFRSDQKPHFFSRGPWLAVGAILASAEAAAYHFLGRKKEEERGKAVSELTAEVRELKALQIESNTRSDQKFDELIRHFKARTDEKNSA
ncbi:hypothetical protein Tsubulata_021381 [Turnera subulata]|uniref:Uncharacterized protein n=1 Tax=Turnera subulata TaxID=218843 RepID=A0A9Q0G106_9ROSI|nr:hypothetical protein Tsubulata_021381 [Turnera subulata]